MATPEQPLAALLRRVDALEARCVAYEATIAERAAVIERQAAEIAELKRRLGLTSRNSSKPPSTDAPGAPARSLRKPSGRRRGGQPGHPPAGLAFAEAPDAIREHRPRACARCGEGLAAGPLALASRHQVTDVPADIRAHVTEHRVYAAACPGCGHVTRAARPAHLPACRTSYGPRVEALVAYLSARHYVPVARLAELLADVLGTAPAAGTVHAMIHRAARRMTGTVARIKAAVAEAAVVGSDETPIREGGRRAEAWVWQTTDAVYMARGPGRGSAVHEREFPGGFPAATLVSDRLAAQLNTPSAAGQVCLAHLMRRCLGLDEAAGASFWPAELLETLTDVSRAGARGRVAGEAERARLSQSVDKLLSDGGGAATAAEVSTRTALRRVRDRLLVCLGRADVPPDNNASERAIRNLKVKLKVSGQWGGERGTASYLALRSVIETAIRRGVQPLTALVDPTSLELQHAS